MSTGTIDRASRPYQDVPPAEAERLLAGGAVALDVRSAREHEEAGHIPGSLLLPLAFLASAPAVLPDGGRPVVLCCSDGVRSRRAARRLAEAGIENLFVITGGMEGWTGPVETGPSPISGPSSWLVANTSLVPPGARTLDVACGRGRHALLLAGAGYMVRAVDRDAARVAQLAALARRLRLPLDAEVVDLEDGDVDLGDGEWGLVLVFRYLHRPLFPALVRALRPGGVLLCETFTKGQEPQRSPSNPVFLLEPGELPELVAPLEVVRQREGEHDGRRVAAVAARKPAHLPPRP
ncbi:MAG: rhodanese-like domain-containing protein [Acidobacteriota bacterium]